MEEIVGRWNLKAAAAPRPRAGETPARPPGFPAVLLFVAGGDTARAAVQRGGQEQEFVEGGWEKKQSLDLRLDTLYHSPGGC